MGMAHRRAQFRADLRRGDARRARRGAGRGARHGLRSRHGRHPSAGDPRRDAAGGDHPAPRRCLPVVEPRLRGGDRRGRRRDAPSAPLRRRVPPVCALGCDVAARRGARLYLPPDDRAGVRLAGDDRRRVRMGARATARDAVARHDLHDAPHRRDRRRDDDDPHRHGAGGAIAGAHLCAHPRRSASSSSPSAR